MYASGTPKKCTVVYLKLKRNPQRISSGKYLSVKFNKWFTNNFSTSHRIIWVKNIRDLQRRILWRFSSSNPVKEYQLNIGTLTYGTAPAAAAASLIAQKCLMTIAASCVDQQPKKRKLLYGWRERYRYWCDIRRKINFDKWKSSHGSVLKA